jgi:hypothetical protein
MSRAEKRACQYTGYCRNQSYTDFLKGYRKAEEDLKLTWQDIALIETISKEFIKNNTTPMTDRDYYQEVLKQFNEKREKQV